MNLVSLGSLRARVVHVGRAPEGAPPLTIVLLHGYGAPGDDLVPLAQEMGAPPGTRIVFPEARLALEDMPGARAWWPLDMARIQVALLTGQIDGFLNEVPEGLAESRAAVLELLDVLERDHGARPERTILGGFSQGAMLALDVALRTSGGANRAERGGADSGANPGARALGGLVLLSGSLICANEWRALMHERRGLPVLMSHGNADPILLFPIAEALRDLLKDAGLDVDWVPFRGGHTIGLEVMERLSSFLAKVHHRVAAVG